MDGGAQARYRDALRSRDLRLLLTSATIDSIGTWASTVVLAVYVFDRTGSTVWIAAFTASRWVPGLLFGTVGGVIADRYERTRVLVVSALLQCLITLGFLVIVGTDGPVWLLLVLQPLAAAAASPYRPAAGALTPEVVTEKDLVAANALISLVESVTVVIGPAVGGLLLVTGHPVTGVALNAASFLVAAALVSRLSVRSRGGAEPGGKVLAQWTAGLRALAHQPTASVLVGYAVLDSAIFGASTVIYAPLSEHLGTSANGYGYLLAGSALGGVLAAGLANRLSSATHLAPVIAVSICAQAVPFALTAAVHAPAAGFALQVVSGAGMVIVDVLAITALQRELAGNVLSRVLGVYETLVLAGTVGASFAAAAIYSATDENLVVVLVAIGVGFPVVALAGLPFLVRADRATAGTTELRAPSVELLGGLDLFVGAPQAVLERLAAASQQVQVPAGTELIRQGDRADALWVLVDGAVTVTVGGGEHSVVAAPGYVGELGLLHGVPRTATVRTSEPTTVMRIDGDDFLDALETARPGLSLLLTASSRLARTAARTRSAGTPSRVGEFTVGA